MKLAPDCPIIEGYQIVPHPSGACIATPDWVWVASQTGRLDFASLLLAAIAILLALFAFFSFGYVSAKAASVARKTAVDVAKDEARRAVSSTVPGLVQEAVPFHLEGVFSNIRGDEVAEAVEDPDTENDKGQG